MWLRIERVHLYYKRAAMENICMRLRVRHAFNERDIKRMYVHMYYGVLGLLELTGPGERKNPRLPCE